MQPTELAEVVTEPLELELTGPGGGTWTIQPAGEDGLISVAPRANLGASATVASTAHNFVSWGTKRFDWRSTCVIEGDENYAASVFNHQYYLITAETVGKLTAVSAHPSINRQVSSGNERGF